MATAAHAFSSIPEKPKYTKKMLAHPVIRVLVEDNPKRLGSAAYARFALYEDGMTVEDFFDRGGRPEDIRWDEEHHYIKVERFQYLPQS